MVKSQSTQRTRLRSHIAAKSSADITKASTSRESSSSSSEDTTNTTPVQIDDTILPFFAFPQEIRDMIYEELLVLPENVKTYNVLYAEIWDKMTAKEPDVILSYQLGKYKDFSRRAKAVVNEAFTAQQLQGRLSFLRVCKQAYTEANSIFYGHNTMQCLAISDMFNFLNSIGPDNQRHLSKINFTFSGFRRNQPIRLLAGCVNLKSIGIKVRGNTLLGSKSINNVLAAHGMAEFRKIRGCKNITVTVDPNLEILEKNNFTPAYIAHVTKTLNDELCRPRKVKKARSSKR